MLYPFVTDLLVEGIDDGFMVRLVQSIMVEIVDSLKSCS